MYSSINSYMHLINTFHHQLSARCWGCKCVCRLMAGSSGSLCSLPSGPGVGPRASALTVERLSCCRFPPLAPPLPANGIPALSYSVGCPSASLCPVMLLAWALPLPSA